MKFERVYRELLLRSLSGISNVKQKDLVEPCQVSIGLINKIARKLEVAQAVEVTKQGIRILSPARILNLWATERKLSRDVIHAFRFDPLEEIEQTLPGSSILTAFSAWRILTGRLPAKYHSLYFYLQDEEEFQRWFKFRESKARKTNPNVFVLRTDPHLLLSSKHGIAPVPQIYVDIYAIGGPEAAPYLRDIVQTYPELSLW